MAAKKVVKKNKPRELGGYGTNDVSGMGVSGRVGNQIPYTSYGRTTKRGMDQSNRAAAKPVKAQSARKKSGASDKAKKAQSTRMTTKAQSIAREKLNTARSQNASSKRMTERSKYNAVKNFETGTTVYKKKTGR